MAHGKDKGSTKPEAEMTSRGHRYDPYGSIQRHQRAVARRQRDKDSANAQSLRKIRDEKWDAIKPHEETLKFDTKFETSL